MTKKLTKGFRKTEAFLFSITLEINSPALLLFLTRLNLYFCCFYFISFLINSISDWSNLTTGAWCYFDNDASNGTKYGKLYNWYAVNDPRGLAPNGYHIPTEAEWAKLTYYLGGIYNAKMNSPYRYNLE